MKLLKIIGVVLVAATIIFLGQRHFGNASSSMPMPAMPGGGKVAVDIVGLRFFATRIEAIGTAYANESVDITATVSERIAKIGFDNGAMVKAGDLLVQLDDAEEQATAEEAKIDLAEQQRELGRIQALFDKEVSPQQELDSRRSAMETATARLAAAQARLRDRAITAPFAGVLGLRRVSPGSLVDPGTVITTLDDLAFIKARFAVPETFLAEVKEGQEIEVGSVAWPDTTFAGVVASVDSRVNPVTRAVTIEAHIPNPELKLRPGMLLTVTLISRPRETVGIPEKALLAYADKHFVFVLTSNSAVERRELRLGVRDVGWVEIESGLNAGETIVIDGMMDLKDGAHVQVAGAENTGVIQAPMDRPPQG
jgi:membrane fusion protein (multidrug efflux system)